jgi:indolepyruvate ferredoxin oxidoreductase alpha subunit
MAVCGDSTFFHAAIPALVNAVHHKSDVILAVLDNSGTAMTGFQPHPGLSSTPWVTTCRGSTSPESAARSARTWEVSDPFDLEETRKKHLSMIEDGSGARVLILRQICALSPERKSKKRYDMRVDETACIGEECGCGRFCTRVFRCPGLVWDREKGKARIDEVICAGCGVCAGVCPSGAIIRTEVA